MEYGAIDLHLKTSLIRIVDGDGVVLEDRTIATTRKMLTQVFGGRPRVRVLLESGTESEWVAQTVEACGPRGDRGRPELRADVWRSGRGGSRPTNGMWRRWPRRVGWAFTGRRIACRRRNGRMRRTVRIREQLVRVRTQTINLLRAQLRQEGLRLPAGAAESVGARLSALRSAAPALARGAGAAAAICWRPLAPLLAAGDARVAAHAAADPVVRRLMTVPGIGPITAVTFRATLDTVERFRDAGASTAFLGLVPREDSSGTRQRKGAITKAGPGPVRALLVQAAWVVWRQRRGRGALHAWVEGVSARRGRRIAIVALARRLARILYAIWRDGTVYQAVPRVVPT